MYRHILLAVALQRWDTVSPYARAAQEVALAAFDLLVGIKAAESPFSVVLTDWLSRMPALGWRRLPAAARTSPRSRSCIRCQVPSRRHWRK
jgi:hypothetical protein